jgi:hypothetical protein
LIPCEERTHLADSPDTILWFENASRKLAAARILPFTEEVRCNYHGNMKWVRILVLAGVTSIPLALAIWWSQRQSGFATPAACLDAYREASRAGDVEKYRSCLAEPLRSETQRLHPDAQELAESLRREMRDVKTWVLLLESESTASTVAFDVDEVCLDGSHRIRFHLQRSGAGWLIAGREQPKLVPAGIPYGTHVSKVSEETPSGTLP